MAIAISPSAAASLTSGFSYPAQSVFRFLGLARIVCLGRGREHPSICAFGGGFDDCPALHHRDQRKALTERPKGWRPSPKRSARDRLAVLSVRLLQVGLRLHDLGPRPAVGEFDEFRV